MCASFGMLLLLYSIYVFSFYQGYFWMLQLTDRFSSINHQTYWKKTISKGYLTIATFLKKLVLSTIILDGIWQWLSIFFFPESKFNVCLCNLRWRHNRFETLRRCYWGIFNFPTVKIWELDPLGTCYKHANSQTCSICRTAELEIPILFFLH